MKWFANGPLSYSSEGGAYQVHWGARFWTAWRWWGTGGARLGDGASMREAMALCEAHQEAA
jgi:hypothetical protein